MTVSYDFESGIPSDFINDNTNPWAITTTNPIAGSQSLRTPNIGDNEFTVIFLIADFQAGNVDFDYSISSEANSDQGYFKVDNGAPQFFSGTASAQSATTTAITAGVHVLQWGYIKDNNTTNGTDDFWIDTVVVPNHTLFDLSNAETFSSGIPAGWTNDATPAQQWSSDGRGVFSTNRLVSATGQNSSDSDLSMTSDSGAPAGTTISIYDVSSEPNFDFARHLIDASEVQSSSGLYGGSGSNTVPFNGLQVYIGSVTAGSHTYLWRFNKDGSASQGADQMGLYLFYEPGMDASSGPTPIPPIPPRAHRLDDQHATIMAHKLNGVLQ